MHKFKNGRASFSTRRLMKNKREGSFGCSEHKLLSQPVIIFLFNRV